MPTTEQGPMTVNDLINQLKLIPGDWYIQINNSLGDNYVMGLEIIDDCNIELITTPIPIV
jgi:hypothetical protein